MGLETKTDCAGEGQQQFTGLETQQGTCHDNWFLVEIRGRASRLPVLRFTAVIIRSVFTDISWIFVFLFFCLSLSRSHCLNLISDRFPTLKKSTRPKYVGKQEVQFGVESNCDCWDNGQLLHVSWRYNSCFFFLHETWSQLASFLVIYSKK
jgi:hypothetical protein